MATRFAYRAVMTDGAVGAGVLDAADPAAAIASLRRMGARPIAVAPAPASPGARRVKQSALTRAATINFITELSALAGAGLPLDRSLALAIANVDEKPLAAALRDMLGDVREGMPLSQAMMRRPGLFPPTAAAMAEAGEANGAVGEALARLGDMMERAEELRRTVANASIYPIVLGMLSIAVILLMLLFVVPRFESLFGQSHGNLPFASQLVMDASRFLRAWGLWLLAGIVAAVFAIRQMLTQPGIAMARDRLALRMPMMKDLVRHIEGARFARTLGILVESDVPLPSALALANRTIGNRAIALAIARVAGGLREGAGLAAPLAEAGVLPRVAIGFLRTGEETSRLGPMLVKLADVLDRDVKVMLQRAIGIATPLITIILGSAVAAIIAAIMSAIIGFNDLAIST
jgi:general secretion pathway protein F